MNQKFWAKQAKLITDTSAILDLSGVLGGEEGDGDAPQAAQLRVYELTNPYEPVQIKSQKYNEQHFPIFWRGNPYVITIDTEVRKNMEQIYNFAEKLPFSTTLETRVFSGQELFFLFYCEVNSDNRSLRPLKFQYANPDLADGQEALFNFFVARGSASIQMPAPGNYADFKQAFEDLKNKYSNRLYLGWGHVHLEASLAARARNLEDFNNSIKQKDTAKPTTPKPHQPLSHDFYPIIPNWAKPQLWGGNLSLLIHPHGYTLYRTNLEREPFASSPLSQILKPGYTSKYESFDFKVGKHNTMRP